MDQDQSTDVRRERPEPDPPEVVEWGDDDGRRPLRAHRALSGIVRDRRLVPVIAGLGLVAVFASLVGEWTIITVPNAGPEGTLARLPVGVADVGAFGTTYLIGVLAVTGSLALALFGTPTIRHDARILGVAMAAGLLVLLGAATASAGDAALRMWNDSVMVEYGRGLIMAYVGTIGLGLALYLAGRFIPSLADAAQAGRPGLRADDAGDPLAGKDWRWRRRRHETEVDAGAEAPIDLTVAPATPFALPEQQDRR